MSDRRTLLRQMVGRPAVPSLEPYDGPWDRPAALHLLRRALVAPTVDEVETALSMTLSDVVDQLIAEQPSLPAPPRFVGECMNASAIYWDAGRVDIIETFFDELRRWWMMLMVNGGLSVRERMTLFWHNHFATNASTIQDSRFLYLQNQLLRRHAIGDFRALVRGITVDKAMLIFLDGKTNKADYRNENYARELQELFTIGITDNDGNANYTQGDIVEAARSLTGWDWLGFGMQGEVSNSVLTGHDAGDKRLYGEPIAGSLEGGPELNRLLDVIFAKEQTARYVVRKLYRFFVHTDTTLTPVRPIASEIETSIIAPLAAELRASGWSIASVLRTLFSSRHFHETAHRGAMVRSPVDLLVGTIRATRTAPITGDAADFAGQYAQGRAVALGQNLFHPPGVQGWQFHRTWISATTLPQRHYHTDELLRGAASTINDRISLIINGPIVRSGTWRVDVLAFARRFASFDDADALVADIATHLLAFPASQQLLTRLRQELTLGRPEEWQGLDETLKAVRLRAMLAVLMRSTNYQLG